MSNVNAVSVVETAAVEGTYIGKDEVTIVSLAEDFTNGLEKSAQGFLEAGRAAWRAKKKSKKEWDDFCRKVAYGNKPSTMNKFIAIGAKYDLYIGHANKLPSAWTTLHLLTSFEGEVFLELVEKGDITPDIKGFQVNNLLGKVPQNRICNKESKSHTSPNDEISVTIKVSSLTRMDQLADIVDLAKGEGFEVICSEEYAKYLEAQNLALPEAA